MVEFSASRETRRRGRRSRRNAKKPVNAQSGFANQENSSGDKGDLRALPIDLPGELSQLGPRHDNDQSAIPDIRILPTLSEICCRTRVDFLPTRDSLNSRDYHEQGVRKLLDIHFRLLREDTSGLLRDSVRVLLDNWEPLVETTKWLEKRKILRTHCPTPVRIYYAAQIKRVQANPFKGLEVDVEFDQINRLKNMSPGKRKNYWLESRALRDGGALLALIDGKLQENPNVVFFQVSKQNITPNELAAKDICDLVSNPRRAMVTLRLTTIPSISDIQGTIRMATNMADRPLILAEFPALLYNSYEGILRCLQKMYKEAQMPLASWIAPQDEILQDQSSIHEYQNFSIPPPKYLGQTTLDLSPILKSGEVNKHDIAFSSLTDPRVLCRQLSEKTSLDPGQAQAMVSAFRTELSLIQGPPGTGKSYVGIQLARCLLANRDILNLGPILCVCYTSHALDQFLQGLYDSGITRILRIGSPSSSSVLESLSLESYKSKRTTRFSTHNKKANGLKALLNALALEMNEICSQLKKGGYRMIGKFLTERFPQKKAQLIEGVMVGEKDILGTWARGNGPGNPSGNGEERSLEQLLSVNIWTLTNDERSRLFQHWRDAATADITVRLYTLLRQHSVIKQQYTALFHEEDSLLFDGVDVVGVTTTGLANNSDLLRRLKAEILICEEAGEVLESHIITSLLPSIQHAILIGDHLQLRPKISNQRLSMDYDGEGPIYNLDQSLFERLANTRQYSSIFPVAQLDHQRRMHPSISALVRETLYPSLIDHESTTSYEEVSGMKARLFWLDHRNDEDPDNPEDPLQSKSNEWEAEMVIAMVQHLCQQEKYKREDIAIITPYVAQLKLIKKKLERIMYVIADGEDREDFEDPGEDNRHWRAIGQKYRPRKIVQQGGLSEYIKLATVDDFQGNEATIVIVSLVRSNRFRNCGFLKTPNRINVLLSRAKHGMYIIGNARTASSTPMWSSVIEILKKNKCIGQKLGLECPRHPDQRIYVSCAEDFQKHAAEGGCSKKCGRRLACGHTCTFKCHSDALHNAVKCMKPCGKWHKGGRKCPNRCHETCNEHSEGSSKIPMRQPLRY